MKKRVVITGVGAVSPIGIGKDEFWTNLVNGKSGVGKITRFDPTEYSTQIAGEVKDFDPTQFIDKKEAKRMDRTTQLAEAFTTYKEGLKKKIVKELVFLSVQGLAEWKHYIVNMKHYFKKVQIVLVRSLFQ